MPGKRMKLTPADVEALRAIRRWPAGATRVHKLEAEVLGTAPALIDDDTLADCCLLLAIIARTKPERVAEFFSLTGDRHEKMAFLLRYGHFETARLTQ